MVHAVRIAGMICVLAVLTACNSESGGGGAPKSKAFPVAVEEVTGRQVEYVVTAVGSVEAFEEVLITSRVSGMAEKINFREGDEVTPDTVLVEIEPKRFKYSQDAAQAAYDRSAAELKEAQDGLKRREDPKGGIFSKEEVEAYRTKVAVAQANEREKFAQLEQAKLDFENATPRAPMAGIVQSRLVQTGVRWTCPVRARKTST